MSARPARWIMDPFGRHQLRYWDGHRWTENVSDAGRTATDPPGWTTAAAMMAPGSVPSLPPAVAPVSPTFAPAPPNSTVEPASSWAQRQQDLQEVSNDTVYRPRANAAARNSVTLTFDDGQKHQLDGPAVIGRDPSTGSGGEGTVAIAVSDITRTVSKTHVFVDPDADGVWVTDQGSTNGTIIRGGPDQRQVLAPQVRAKARLGEMVHFGDRWFKVD